MFGGKCPGKLHVGATGRRPGNASDGASQLDRSDCDRALANADRNCFPGIPFLLKVADLPLFRRHDASHFLRQIDAGLLSQTQCCSIVRNSVNPSF